MRTQQMRMSEQASVRQWASPLQSFSIKLDDRQEKNFRNMISFIRVCSKSCHGFCILGGLLKGVCRMAFLIVHLLFSYSYTPHITLIKYLTSKRDPFLRIPARSGARTKEAQNLLVSHAAQPRGHYCSWKGSSSCQPRHADMKLALEG